MRCLAAAAFGATLVVAPAGARAQDPTRCPEDLPRGQHIREVRRLAFEGNTVFTDAELANSIVTERSSLIRRVIRVRGRQRCLPETEFANDVRRILKLYRESGYAGVEVDTAVTPLSESTVAVRFSIREGAPIVVDSLRILGMGSVPDSARVVRRLPLAVGQPFNRYALRASIDTIIRRLRDGGYPAADVFLATSTNHTQRRAVVELEVEPGTRARLGTIAIDVTPRDDATPQRIDSATVRSLLGVRDGALYRESQLQRAKLNLYQTDAYRAVAVDVDSASVEPPGDSLVTVHVRLTEGFTKSARASGGYGTLDCFRTDGEYQNYNFLSSARRLEVRARLSKIGIGRPLSGAAALCPWLRDDPYSEKLNYALAASLSEPRASLLGFRPTLTVFSERRSEYNAFLRTTPLGGSATATRQSLRRTQTITYQAEYGRTEAQPAVFCALQNICVPEDREPLLAYRWLSTIGLGLSYRWSDDPQYPTRGGTVRLDIRHASRTIGSDSRLQFSKGVADLNLSFSMGRGVVLAPRVQVGAVVGPSFTGTSRFIPQQERLYAGGANTVRGYGHNELGPRAYIARGFDTVRAPGAEGPLQDDEAVFFRVRAGAEAERSVPTGGSALVVGNLELRIPSPVLTERATIAAFVDAGELWSPGAQQAQSRFSEVKWTPGFGVRVATPIGAIRVDLAYNRYARRAGAAYYDTPISLGGQLYCVSPGNTLAVTGLGGESAPVQASGNCPADFQPPSVRGFLRRWALSFGIGQAY